MHAKYGSPLLLLVAYTSQPTVATHSELVITKSEPSQNEEEDASLVDYSSTAKLDEEFLLRGLHWQELAKSKIDRPTDTQSGPAAIDGKDLYATLVVDSVVLVKKDVNEAIKKDLHRTFSAVTEKAFFKEKGGEGQARLHRVLRTYSVYNEAVGYDQAVSYVVGLFLLHMSEEDAFFMLVSMFKRSDFAGIFGGNLTLVSQYMDDLTRLLKTRLPSLHGHLQNKYVEPLNYAFEWFTTVCIKRFPMSTTVRVWDMFLKDGIKAVFRVALAMLSLLQKKLLEKHDYGEILNILQTAPSEVKTHTLMKKCHTLMKKGFDYKWSRSLRKYSVPECFKSADEVWKNICKDKGNYKPSTMQTTNVFQYFLQVKDYEECDLDDAKVKLNKGNKYLEWSTDIAIDRRKQMRQCYIDTSPTKQKRKAMFKDLYTKLDTKILEKDYLLFSTI